MIIHSGLKENSQYVIFTLRGTSSKRSAWLALLCVCVCFLEKMAMAISSTWNIPYNNTQCMLWYSRPELRTAEMSLLFCKRVWVKFCLRTLQLHTSQNIVNLPIQLSFHGKSERVSLLWEMLMISVGLQDLSLPLSFNSYIQKCKCQLILHVFPFLWRPVGGEIHWL